MTIDKEKFLQEVKRSLSQSFDKELDEASSYQLYFAISKAVLGSIWHHWENTREAYKTKDIKEAYYLSAEFLMGRAMSNNLVNLGIENEIREVLDSLGLDYNLIEDTEPDAGLGNGGLGRLAACFLDSLSTLDLPATGYGIRYKYGMFKQIIQDGYQIEKPDAWLEHDNPWSIKRPDYSVTVKFGGEIVAERDAEGRINYKRINTEDVLAIPFDMPIIGYGTDTINNLRLWEAQSPDGFDLQLFNNEQYLKAVEKANSAEDISRVLYPNDMGPLGKTLRLKQQYFFVSASLQDIFRKYKVKMGNDFSRFPELVAIQLNDTHPVVAIPELMRIFLDVEGMSWTEAWGLTTKTFAYTNHTILAEALEKWPIDIFQNLLPRLYQIVEEINRRFLEFVRGMYPGDWEKQSRMAIIHNGMIKMAWLAITGSHSVNGVAALHTEILKHEALKDWYDLFPEKFNNKTNGVTQRRWLLKSNPELADFITSKIGNKWIADLSELEKLKKFADNKTDLKKIETIKNNNKAALAAYIKEHNGIEVNPDSIFDVQIKRLHEYKRQLLNVLHILYLYRKLKEDPSADIVPRTFIFGAKAASGYRMAKLIIKLINDVADLVNNDESTGNKIKVVFIENYRVSVAEKIFPASDISEQISTAGKEASGTGNMKFMMNGALTMGTLDGANIEIVEEAGEENAFIFGLTSEEISRIRTEHSYRPHEILAADNDLKMILNMLIDGTFGSYDIYREIYDSLVYGIEGNKPDTYFVLKDFRSYVEAQARAAEVFKDRDKWNRMAFMNIASSGKFSSDRTIREYASEIWDIKPRK
ncbi:MAG: glycogen/starch/alpha-glucan phosphorylase [Spirochaetales bacterium]|nr:glycogen/starch/alpha-glucan phosphorylase [Spirochaetales bacterium]